MHCPVILFWAWIKKTPVLLYRVPTNYLTYLLKDIQTSIYVSWFTATAGYRYRTNRTPSALFPNLGFMHVCYYNEGRRYMYPICGVPQIHSKKNTSCIYVSR